MALYLPRNLGALSKLAPKENPRCAFAGVRVFDNGDTYRLEVTDGKILCIARGQSDTKDPGYPPLDAAPNGAGVAVVPRESWEQAFELAKKDKALRAFPVGISLGEGSLTFAVREHTFTAEPLAGSYPNVDGIIPKRPPLVNFVINPKIMIAVCQAALALMGDDESRALTVCYYGKDEPLGAMCSTSEGLFVDFLIMPLNSEVSPIEREKVKAKLAREEEIAKAPDEPEPVSEQAMDRETQVGHFFGCLQLSADTPQELRACDVDRVMQAAHEGGFLEEFRNWLLNQFPGERPLLKKDTAKKVKKWQPEPPTTNGHVQNGGA